MRTISFLVVEDNNLAMDVVGKLLVYIGASHVQTFCEPKKVVDVALSKHFDLIIANYRVSSKKELEFFKKIRKAGCETPFLLITTDLDNDRLQKLAASGLHYVIQKPFDLETFSEAVYAALWNKWVPGHRKDSLE